MIDDVDISLVFPWLMIFKTMCKKVKSEQNSISPKIPSWAYGKFWLHPL